jgi:hypothetical protein
MASRLRHLSSALALVLTVAIAIPLAAHAATTIGQTDSNSIPCVGPYFVMQTDVGSQPGYLVPPGRGVITSWSVDDTKTGQAGASLRLMLMRPVTGATYTVVARDSPRTISSPSALNTFNSRIPVSGGEIPALWVAGTPVSIVSCEFSTANSGDVLGVASVSTEPQKGDTVGLAGQSSTRLNLSALVAPDADGDGYGDQSQDACPQDPAIHTLPCAADQRLNVQATPRRIGVGQIAVLAVRVSNAGRGTSLGAALDVAFGHGLKLLISDASCTHGTVYTCGLGPIAPGRSVRRLFVVQATKAGKHAISLAARQSDVDPVPGNNSANVTITVVRH